MNKGVPMQVGDIIKILEKQSPPEYAMDWDHVGLLVGRRNREVDRLVLALDATAEVINYAIEVGAQMIVTHHPMIFSKVDRVNDDTVLGQKILALAETGTACFAMHTNFDTRGGMGRLAAEMIGLHNVEVLEETMDGEGIGCVGLLDYDKPLSLTEMTEKVKETFGLERVVVFGNPNAQVDKVAISPGSGKSVIGEAIKKGADCLITGDIGHHDGIDAVEAGLTIIDASHYGIEKIFVSFMKGYLTGYLQGVEILEAPQQAPFQII